MIRASIEKGRGDPKRRMKPEHDCVTGEKARPGHVTRHGLPDGGVKDDRLARNAK